MGSIRLFELVKQTWVGSISLVELGGVDQVDQVKLVDQSWVEVDRVGGAMLGGVDEVGGGRMPNPTYHLLARSKPV